MLSKTKAIQCGSRSRLQVGEHTVFAALVLGSEPPSHETWDAMRVLHTERCPIHVAHADPFPATSAATGEKEKGQILTREKCAIDKY